MRYKIVVLFVLILLSACTAVPKGLGAPEFVSAQVEVKGASAVFTCELTSDRVEQCGILLDGSVLEGVLDGNSFSAAAGGLEIDRTHVWSAFARAGGSEIRSEEEAFDVPDGAIPIPDPAFKAYLTQRYDINRDGEISLKEAEIIWRIDFCTNALGVKSIEGIAYMPNLEEIHCVGDWLDSFDLGTYPYYYRSRHYTWDNCIGPIGTLESLDISGNPKLRILEVWDNSALGDLQGTLDISHNPLLEQINICFTNLAVPDVSSLAGQLTHVGFSHLRGALPDARTMPSLKYLDISFEQTGRHVAVDVSRCPDLEELLVSGTVSSLSDLSMNPKLTELAVTCCDFREIDLSTLPHLKHFNGSMNFFKSVDVSANSELKELYLSPMNDDVLEVLYIAPGQQIPGVTVDRSSVYIPDRTVIVEKSVE